MLEIDLVTNKSHYSSRTRMTAHIAWKNSSQIDAAYM